MPDRARYREGSHTPKGQSAARNPGPRLGNLQNTRPMMGAEGSLLRTPQPLTSGRIPLCAETRRGSAFRGQAHLNPAASNSPPDLFNNHRLTFSWVDFFLAELWGLLGEQ